VLFRSLEGKIEFHWKTNLTQDCHVSNVSLMDEAERFQLPPPLRKFTHVFQLVDSTKTREFAASSNEEAQKWIEALRKAIVQRNAMSVRGIPIKVAPFKKLLTDLSSSPTMRDSELLFVKAFFSTYRAFATPSLVFDGLRGR